MPQTCSVCKSTNRLEIEKALIAGTASRTIASQFGPSRAAVMRHRDHIAGQISEATEVRELGRKNSLLDDVRTGEDRVEKLFGQAEIILATAIKDRDGRGASQALRAAVSVLAEARNFMALRGELTNELGRDRSQAELQVQIICPWAPADRMPRIVFGSADEFDGSDLFATVGTRQAT